MMRATTTGQLMSGGRVFAALAGGCVLSALLAGASIAGSLGDDGWVANLTEKVRDTESGARAKVSYFPRITTGGEERHIDDRGEEMLLHWEGFKGVFEVEFISAPGIAPADTLIFARDAIVAVCPSVDGDALADAPIETVQPGLYRVDAQCPDIDMELVQ